MRDSFPPILEDAREAGGHYGTYPGDRNGRFFVKSRNVTLQMIASDGSGWEEAGMPLPAFEHVSVSLPHRAPRWYEMAQVKDWFWLPDETVFQYHPPQEVYVNFHPHCLHLWKPVGVEIPVPPAAAVGPR